MTLASFVETRLEIGKDYGAVGGSEFNTTVIEMGSGREKRNSNHANNLGRWDLGSRNLIKADIEYLHGFFRARRGKAQGFRYKDWLNFDVTDEPVSHIGNPTLQLEKTYSDGGEVETLKILKPVAGLTMKKNGSSFVNFSVDTATGIVTTTPDHEVSIVSISRAANGICETYSNHGFNDGDAIWLGTITGMTELSNTLVTISGASGSTFELNVDTSAFSSFNGGAAEKHIQPYDTLTWTGEFDTPARFDTDTFKAEFIHYRDSDKEAVFNLQSLPIVGLKL